MKPSDIVPGKKYKHSNYPGFTYLGIGRTKVVQEGGFPRCYFNSSKDLVIIESGSIVLRPGQMKDAKKFWNKFSPIN
jgi:hypothetical protein